MRRSSRSARWAMVGVMAAGLAAACAGPASRDLAPEDLAAIRTLEQAYVSAWVRNDRDSVLATLREDAVLLPDGLPPVEGLDAIEEFWWPAEGPATTVTAYRTTIDELGGSGTVGYVRGHGELSFTWDDGRGGSGRRTTRSVFLMVVRKGPDGSWRIANRMWSSLSE